MYEVVNNPFLQGGFSTFCNVLTGMSTLRWIYVMGNLLTWSACFFVPIILLTYWFKKEKERKLSKGWLLFAMFLLLCGITFLVETVTEWIPLNSIHATIRLLVGISAWITAYYVIRRVPVLFSMRSGRDMQAEIDSRIEVEKELKQKNEQLQEAERLAKLGYIKWDVVNEMIEYSDAVPDLLEVARNEKLTYKVFTEIIHREDIVRLDKVIDTIFIRKFFPSFYCRVNTPVSGIKHLLVLGEVILSPSGAITAVKGTIQDVTEQRLYMQKVQSQNQQLKDIAWIQSHKVRAPVASILGLIQLFNTDHPEDPINTEVLQGVSEAANMLDEVIKEINAKTQSDATTENEAEHI